MNTIVGAMDGETEAPCMTRVWIGRLRFHLFHRGDKDPDCHDHPWDFWTFPLRSYVEEVVLRDDSNPNVLYRSTVLVRAFRPHYRPASHCHRVLGPWSGLYRARVARHRGNGDFESFDVVATAQDLNALRSSQTFVFCRQPVAADNKKIPTLVWRGKSTREWGFWKFRAGRWCWVFWKTYVYQGGKAAPCQPED